MIVPMNTQPSRAPRDYDDIPGTYVFDGAHSRKGYALNMFCMSLNSQANRDAFSADPEWDELRQKYFVPHESPRGVFMMSAADYSPLK